MPATYNYNLLNYEGNIEDALAAYLGTAITSTQILTPRVVIGTAPNLTTPRVSLAVQISGTNANQTSVRTTDSKEYEGHKTGTVTLNCVVRRDATGQAIGTLRGKVRVAMLEATAALTGTNLPNYQILTLREGSSTVGADPDNDEISCQISYALEFWIKPDQWAAT